MELLPPACLLRPLVGVDRLPGPLASRLGLQSGLVVL